MTGKNNVSPRALLMAVVAALLVGVMGSLAIRPAGVAGKLSESATTGEFEEVRWRVTSSFNFNLPIIGPPPQNVAYDLARISGGAFQMEIFEPGKIVPALEITESVKEGKVQAGFQWVGYDQGRIPASTLISAVPFGMEPMEFSAWWYHGGGRELGEALYEPHNIMPILCGVASPETAGWFREPVESLDDLVG